MPASLEKRSHPRVKDRLTLRSSSPHDGSHEMATLNLSLSGAHVTAGRFIPLMTRFEVTLMLPPEDGLEARPYPVSMEAVVVRVHPQEAVTGRDRYEIGLFFSRMEQRDRNALARYLSSRSRQA